MPLQTTESPEEFIDNSEEFEQIDEEIIKFSNSAGLVKYIIKGNDYSCENPNGGERIRFRVSNFKFDSNNLLGIIIRKFHIEYNEEEQRNKMVYDEESYLRLHSSSLPKNGLNWVTIKYDSIEDDENVPLPQEEFPRVGGRKLRSRKSKKSRNLKKRSRRRF